MQNSVVRKPRKCSHRLLLPFQVSFSGSPPSLFLQLSKPSPPATPALESLSSSLPHTSPPTHDGASGRKPSSGSPPPPPQPWGSLTADTWRDGATVEHRRLAGGSRARPHRNGARLRFEGPRRSGAPLRETGGGNEVRPPEGISSLLPPSSSFWLCLSSAPF